MMEMQSESAEPPPAAPCDPPPPGKINKAAFKLFGKRRAGSGMAGFFSLRNKGENGNSGNSENGNSSVNGNSVNGNSVNGNSAAELVRSRTHDGLTTTETDGQRGEEPAGQEAGPVRSLSKSLSFFSLLRRGSGAANEGGGARLGRRGRGLKGFFSSMRWRRKERAPEVEGEVVEATEVREGDVLVPEEGKDVTLTLEPPPCAPQEDHGSLEAEPNNQGPETYNDIAMSPTHSVANTQLDSPDTPSTSPLRAPPLSNAVSTVTATPPLDCCSGAADPPSEPSVDRLCSLLFTDVTSLKSFDSLTGCGDIIADAEEEGGGGNGGSGTSSSSSGGGGGGGNVGGGGGGGVAGGRPGVAGVLRNPTSKPPLSALSAHSGSAPSSGPARARMPAPPPQQPSGSGIVAYMGGGEEMASPDGVDDADMQGLWHMLPTTGDNSPALPRPHPNPRGADRKVSQVKGLGLSKIPVVGGGGGGAGSRVPKPPLPHTHVRHPSSPNEKEPLSDEGYWDTPTATPTAPPDDGGLLRNQGLSLTRDSCSGDALYDLYNNQEEDIDRSDEEQEEEDEEEDLTSIPSPSTGDSKLSPTSQTRLPSSSSSSSFRSIKGSTSLPRDSKIPVSVRQTTPPHSVSQSALSSVLEVTPPPTKTQAPVRTRIPVSKVPVRRSGNKSAHRK